MLDILVLRNSLKFFKYSRVQMGHICTLKWNCINVVYYVCKIWTLFIKFLVWYLKISLVMLFNVSSRIKVLFKLSVGGLRTTLLSILICLNCFKKVILFSAWLYLNKFQQLAIKYAASASLNSIVNRYINLI